MEIELNNVAQIVPTEQLKHMRKLKELQPYLPADVAGLRVYVDKSKEGNTRLARAGSFTTLSNTPAVQNITKAYDPRDIVKYVEKEVPRNYDPDLIAWEGDWTKVLEPRGGRNPFHLLEQALVMGPSGDEYKRGATPFDWRVLDAATDEVIKLIRDRLPGDVTPKHLIPVTPNSTRLGLRIAHVLNNSAGEPFFSDPNAQRTAKKYHLEQAIEMAAALSNPATTSLPLWPFVGFARGDRAAPWAVYQDRTAHL